MQTAELWTTSRQTSLRLRAYDGAGPGGPSVVMLHGMVTSVDGLRSAVPGFNPYKALAAHGLNVAALDWPGHGRSGGRRGHLTYRRAMSAAARAADAARARWDGPVGYVGTGLGGPLAFYAALEGEGIGAVACHNLADLRDVRPVLHRLRQQTLWPLAARLRRRLSWEAQSRVPLPVSAIVATDDLAEDPALADRLRRHPQAVRRYDLGGLGSILLSPDDKPDVAAQRVPTFVAVGADDRAIPPTPAHTVVSRLTCPHEMWVLPGGGHQLLLEHPRAAIPRIAAFLLSHLTR